MYADPEFAAGLANYQELAANFAHRCRERRNTEEAQREELAELTKPATVCKSNVGVLVHKIHDNNVRVADDSSAVERTLPAHAAAAQSGSEMAWWQWVDSRIEGRLEEFGEQVSTATGGAMAEWVGGKLDPIKRELEQQRRELTVSLREQVLECGRALREEARAAREQDEHERDLLVRELSALREQVGAEREFKAREIEQLRCAVDLHAEYQLGVKELRDQIARAKDAQAQAGEELLRRELAVLQKEIGLERAVRALHDEVEVAKSEIPQVPAIEARVTAELAAHKTETERLEAELKTTKDRLSNLRDYTLTQMERKQAKRATPEPAIEIKLETSATQFVMRDIDPDAMEAWRRFAAGMLEAQQDAETTLSITRATGAAGQVVALPVRKNGNAA